MNCKIQVIEKHNTGRILAVSDVHGYVHYLEGALKKVQYSEQDTLVIVGDLIEKGPESLKAVRYVLGLRERNPKVYAVMGNVDCHRLSSFYNDSPEGTAEFFEMLKWTKKVWKRGLFLDMLGELGISLEDAPTENPEEMVRIKQQIHEQYAKELDFLWNLPTVVVIGNFLFVHAGVPTDDLDALEKVNAFSCMKIDAFVKTDVSFEKNVVVGHWPVCLCRDDIDCMNPIFDRQKHIIAIDGGCALKYGEQMNVLLIPGQDADFDDVTYVSYDDCPVITAEKDQEGRAPTIVVRYFDSEVEVLDGQTPDGKMPQEKLDVVTLRHISSGRNFVVPGMYLYYRGDKVYCNDCSDALLEIKQGDRLSVVVETSAGYVVKKNGVLGWYMV